MESYVCPYSSSCILLPVMSTVTAACNAADRGATLRYVHRSLLVSDLRDRQHPVFAWRRTWWKQRANSNNGVVLDLQSDNRRRFIKFKLSPVAAPCVMSQVR